MDLLGLDRVAGYGVLTWVVGIALALVAWTPSSSCGCCGSCRRSRTRCAACCPGRCSGRPGFEVLKLVGGYYLALISGSVTASAFGGAVGLLVWINLVARFAFFTAAWTATLRRWSGVPGAARAAAAPVPA